MLRAKAKENQSAAGGDKTKACERAAGEARAEARAKAGALLSKTTKPTEEPVNVQKALAKEADVSQGTLHNYLQIKNSGKPKLLEKVQSGELKIGTAHRMLMPQIRKQLDEADKMVAYIKKHMPLVSEEQKLHVQELLDQLAEQMKGYSWVKN